MRRAAFILLFTSIFLISLNAKEVPLAFDSIEINVHLSEADEYIDIGFADSPVAVADSKFPIDSLEHLTLIEEERETGHVLKESVHAYWNVISPNNFRLSLSGTVLTNDNGDVLDFVASWIPFGDDEPVNVGENGNLEAKELYTHRPEIGLSHMGSSEVSIETEVLENASPGVYHGDFILLVESE